LGSAKIEAWNVFALQGLPELVVVIPRRTVLLCERVSAGTVGRDDRGQPCLSSRSCERRQQRALDERPAPTTA